jgi:hypothetical protein
MLSVLLRCGMPRSPASRRGRDYDVMRRTVGALPVGVVE